MLDKPGPEVWNTTEELTDLFDNAPCGYVVADPDGIVLCANETLSRWLGFPQDSLTGKRFSDLLSIGGRIFYETHFAPLLRMQGHFDEVAAELLTADAVKLPVLLNAVERRNPNGDVMSLRITVFNASDRRKYERELLDAREKIREANEALVEVNATLEKRVADEVRKRLQVEAALHQSQKMEAIGQLSGGIAHDFNNMLAVVMGGLNLLKRRISTGKLDGAEQLIASALDSANRAAVLTKRLLAFSRQQPLEPSPLNANTMVSDMSNILSSTIGSFVQLETVLGAGLWKTFADASQLENAILNLAVNARDAMPDGGSITIETANAHIGDDYAREHDIKPGQYVMVAVTDTGTGMSPDTMRRAFEPFYTTKPVGKGTGLGLSQVFGFVKQSEGHIKIYSELGVGTTIKIYLPRYYGAQEAQSRAEVTIEIPKGSPKETILLVEDDPHVRALSKQMLLDLGYTVIGAENAAEALSILGGDVKVELLLTDIVMPGVNGRQLADKARTMIPDLKVLFTTGYTQNAIVHNGVLDPGVNFLQKPATMEQLAQKVRAVLDTKG